MPYLLMMIGAPGSGKTTLARKLTPWLEAVYVNLDDVRDEFPHFMPGEIVRTAQGRLHRALGRGLHCILDAKNVRADHRQNFMEIAPRSTTSIIAVVMDTPFEACWDRHLRRTPNRSQATLTSDIVRQEVERLKRYPPQRAEGFHQIITITPDTPDPVKAIRESLNLASV